MTELGLSSGTVSFRMERLERAGLIERRGDPDDRRNVLIRLTDDGRALFERVAPAHLANEQRMLSGLTDDERATLADLLRKLLVEYEGSTPPPDATLALGLTLAPAHKAMQLRRTVGLPDIAGLLVRTVDEDSPAARAGLTRGDILLRAAGRELRAVSALYEALDDAADGNRRLRITVLRGTDQITATLKLETRADAQLVVAAGTPFQEHRL
jgi:DNA-binding transcriptional ArsR family regulator